MLWIWSKVIKPTLDAIGHFETASAIKTLLWPFILTASAAVSGYLGQAPVMWIIMAATLTFMGASVGVYASSLYRERKNPLNKLVIRGTIFPFDLAAAPQNNRKTRQGMAKTGLVVPLPPRRIAQAQLGVEIINTATFPLSVISFSAVTEIEGKTPPRTQFPKEAAMIQPGASFWVHDERIELDIASGLLNGSIDIVIKYGLPKRENYTLHHKGTVEIFLEPNGWFRGVYFHPKS